GEKLLDAYSKAYEADSVSIFGGIVAVNREIDRALAEKMKEIFLEIIIAPSFSEEALDVLTTKENWRLLTVNMSDRAKREKQLTGVRGGLLVQNEDDFGIENAEISVPTKREPTEKEWAALKLGWRVVKHVKSNAIVLANDTQTVGV